LALRFLVVEVVDLTLGGVGVPAVAGTEKWGTLASHRSFSFEGKAVIAPNLEAS
jgi:hypothetical protein